MSFIFPSAEDELRKTMSKIKAQSWDPQLVNNASGGIITSGTIYYTAVYLTAAQVITGCYIPLGNIASYTPNNKNRVGLYSTDGTTLTLVASCADTPTMWIAATGTLLNVTYSSTYNAPVGLYYVAYLWNSSATVTAPTINRMTFSGVFVNAGKVGNDFRNGVQSGQTDLPATQVISGISNSGGSGQVAFWAGIY